MRRWFGSGCGCLVTQYPVGEGAEFQLLEDGAQFLAVDGFASQSYLVEGQRHVGANRGQETREFNLLAVRLDFGFESPLQLVGMGQQIFDAAKVGDEFHGCLFAHTGTARNVVGAVAHESQDIDYLLGRIDAVFGLYFVGAQYLEIAAELGAIHEDVG